MSQGTVLGTPSSMLNGVLVTLVQHLDQVGILSTTVLPVELANLVIVMKQVQAALATATAASSDLANAIGGDLDLVDLLFSERLAAVGGVGEFAAAGC